MRTGLPRAAGSWRPKTAFCDYVDANVTMLARM